MNIKTCVCMAGLIAMSALGASRAHAQTVGLIANPYEHRVQLFDAESDLLLGSLPLAEDGTASDCSISLDRNLGFVTDLQSRVWVVDLTTVPPRLAAGTNPISISNVGLDTAITPDGKYLLVCGGHQPEPLSVIEIASRTEIETFPIANGCTAVEVCDNGSVLVGSYQDQKVHRLRIDGAGHLTDAFEALDLSQSFVSSPMNVTCAPGSRSGVVVQDIGFTTFRIPGLARVQSGPTGEGFSAAFNPAGDRLFVLSILEANAFAFNPGTGFFQVSSLFNVRFGDIFRLPGIDQLAVHPSGSKFYLWDGFSPAPFGVHETATGQSIHGLNVYGSRGVCLSPFSPELTVRIDFKPGDESNHFNSSSKGSVPVALLSTSVSDGDALDFDVRDVDPGAVLFFPSGVASTQNSLVDVDRDGDLDLLLHFPSAGIPGCESTAYLWGKTRQGMPFVGSDTLDDTRCR
jgi:hypothetical protein